MIAKERKALLDKLVEYINGKISKSEDINLNFICTHNSRRSHLAQIWAQIAAYENGIKNVFCYSGGTEATAMFPMIAETLSEQGLQVFKLSNEINPIYAFRYDDIGNPIICFSKVYDHSFNPKHHFAAVMTCSDADSNCPIVFGAEARLTVTYEDPKVSDGTKLQKEVYLERSEQIKEEMEYVFKKVRDELSG